jgi:hypothetical protein
MNAVLEFLSSKPSIEYGISKTSASGFLVRILGYKAEQLYDCLQVISRMVESAPAIMHTTN